MVSELSDAAVNMREKDSGVETRLRENVPHLLDIDVEVCHHQHNIVKEFAKPFEKHVENFLRIYIQTQCGATILWVI